MHGIDYLEKVRMAYIWEQEVQSTKVNFKIIRQMKIELEQKPLIINVYNKQK